MRIKAIKFREYTPPPGSVANVHTLEFGKASSYTVKEGALGLVVTFKEHIRLYPWSMIAFVDYAEDK